MWQKGILGGDPQSRSLLDTMLYMNGLYFASCGGKEHRYNCDIDPALQIQMIERVGKKPYLMYKEDISKNNQGRLKAENKTQNCANLETPKRLLFCSLQYINSTTVFVHVTAYPTVFIRNLCKSLLKSNGIPQGKSVMLHLKNYWKDV